MKRYLLSTGASTTEIEKYVLDLFKLYIQIYPGDIPGSNVVFNFIFTDVKKDEVVTEIRSRVSSLISKIKDQFSTTLDIQATAIDLIDEERVLITINVNNISDSVIVNLYN